MGSGARRVRAHARRVCRAARHAGAGPERLLKAFRLGDDLGQLSYRIWYYAGLNYDQDQRDNAANARRQKVQILFAKAAEARSWFTPELLRIPLATVRAWMNANPDLATYRFAIESTYHQQEHVLDEKGRAAAVAVEPARRCAARRPLDARERRHQASRHHAPRRQAGDAHLRPVQRAAADQSPSAGSRGRIRGVPRDVCRKREYVCGGLQRRAAARLVHRAGAAVQEHARRGAARQRHSDRRSSRTSSRRRRRAPSRCGGITACANGARPRDLPRVRPARSADRLRSQVPSTRK